MVLRFDADLAERLDARCAQFHRSRNEFVQAAVKTVLDQLDASSRMPNLMAAATEMSAAVRPNNGPLTATGIAMRASAGLQFGPTKRLPGDLAKKGK